MNPLTENQQRAWDLRESGMTFKAIAEETGQRPQEVQNAYQRAKKKMEKMELLKPRTDRGPQPIEETDPAKAAAAIEMLSEPNLESLSMIADELKLPKSTIIALQNRLRSKYLGVKMEVGMVKTPVFQGKIDGLINVILDSIDEFDLMKASLKDKVGSASLLLEKRQLLSGEPTQILSINERKEINDLVPILMQEAKRRGVTIDVDPATGKVLATQP